MAGVISESFLSRPFTIGLQQCGRELIFDVQGTEDEAEVFTLMNGFAPAVYFGMLLDSFDAEPLGGGLWKGHAKYVRLENDNEYTFDTGGGTSKITQSLATIASYAPTGMTAPDFQGAIGVSEDKVEGVDIPSPKFDWTETHIFANSAVDGTYKRALMTATGCMNIATFKGLAAGECLFLGAAGSKKGNTQWSITFRFSGSPNVTGLTIGTITGIDKLGWDYLWVRYADFQHSAAYTLVKRPVAAYVERVFRTADFSVIGIGTT